MQDELRASAPFPAQGLPCLGPLPGWLAGWLVGWLAVGWLLQPCTSRRAPPKKKVPKMLLFLAHVRSAS